MAKKKIYSVTNPLNDFIIFEGTKIDCAEFLKVSEVTITSAIYRKNKVKGYFVSEKGKLDEFKKKMKEKKNPILYSIYDVTDGEICVICDTAEKCSEYLNMDKNNFYTACKKHSKVRKTYRCERIGKER